MRSEWGGEGGASVEKNHILRLVPGKLYVYSDAGKLEVREGKTNDLALVCISVSAHIIVTSCRPRYALPPLTYSMWVPIEYTSKVIFGSQVGPKAREQGEKV